MNRGVATLIVGVVLAHILVFFVCVRDFVRRRV